MNFINNKVPKILAFGDSHAIIFCKIGFVSEHWLGFKGGLPVTMYRLGKEGLNIMSAPKIIGNGHEKYTVKTGDIILYSYGYNDIQKSIPQQLEKGRELEEILDNLVNNYIDQIKSNEIKFSVKSIVYSILPPTQKNKNLNQYGSINKKIFLTKELNKKLFDGCKKNNIAFFDAHEHVVDENKEYINKKLVQNDGVHIDLDKSSVIEYHLRQFINDNF